MHWHTFSTHAIQILVQVAIMPRMPYYVKGFKISRERIATMVGVRDVVDPEVNATIPAIVHLLDRSAYLRVVCGWVPATPDRKRHLALIIALAFGADKDELKEKDLGEIDESIKRALPHVLEGPDVWELWD